MIGKSMDRIVPQKCHMARSKTQYELRKKANDPSYKRKKTNLPAKKYKKTNPTTTRLSFEFTGGETKFIDLAKALSIVNRKLYRQGVYYYVNSIEVYNDSDEYVDVHVLPDNWITRNAYVRAQAIFEQMNDLVLNNQRTIAPKYHDFKVYMSNLHRTAGSADPEGYGVRTLQGGIDSQTLTADNWEYSQLISADSDGDTAVDTNGNIVVNQEADNFYLHMIGDHFGNSNNWESVGVIKSYAETRRRANFVGEPVIEPANLRADPMANLFDWSSEEQLNDIITRLDLDNDETPYEHDNYVGEHKDTMCQVARLVTTQTIGRTATAPGFCAPLGLIAIDSAVASGDAFRVVINVAPGTYHGVYAERV